jgi:hypothetical protein
VLTVLMAVWQQQALAITARRTSLAALHSHQVCWLAHTASGVWRGVWLDPGSSPCMHPLHKLLTSAQQVHMRPEGLRMSIWAVASCVGVVCVGPGPALRMLMLLCRPGGAWRVSDDCTPCSASCGEGCLQAGGYSSASCKLAARA